MIIAPKLSTRDMVIPETILELYEGAVEVQMLTNDISKETKDILPLLEKLPTTKVLNVHLPFGLHTMVTYLASAEYRAKLVDLMKTISVVPSSYIIMHCETEIFTLYALDWDYVFTRIYEDAGCHTKFCFENGIVNPCRRCFDIPDAAELLTDAARMDFVCGCIDLCHLKASYNLTGMPVRYSNTALKKVVCYHVADAWNNDGWKDITTHGRRFPTYQAFTSDMDNLMENFPVNEDTVFVMEISEGDYKMRPDQCEMLRWAHRYFRE